jgi:Zn-dependent protease with chaperone function
MAITVTCDSCHAAIRVKDEHAGKRGQCPRCRAAVVVPGPPPPAGETRPLDLKVILAAFSGEVAPVRTTLPYRIGIALLAGLVVVLPILYLGVIAGVGYLLFLHATQNLATIARSHSVWAIIFAYGGPIIAGGILLFFLCKPLFARRSRYVPVRRLEFGEEPLLFALVTRVANALGAPEPKSIDLDCQANASASFGRFFGGDLTLTLGLPLVASLTVQELAGVIAHELGHFAQGTAMRLNYLVRSINRWFERAVYERDDWDASLAGACESNDRLVLIFWLAALAVWLTRRVLWVFMVLSHGLSCFLMRQMEYDADRRLVRLAGSDSFAEMSRKIMLLSAVSDAAFQIVSIGWYSRGRVPDDVNAYQVALAAHIPADAARQIEAAIRKSGTGLFDTHPSHKDRLASARRENAPGVFHLDGLAAALFGDFDRTSRTVTFDFYRQALGKRVKRDALIPVAEMFDTEAANENAPGH